MGSGPDVRAPEVRPAKNPVAGRTKGEIFSFLTGDEELSRHIEERVARIPNLEERQAAVEFSEADSSPLR